MRLHLPFSLRKALLIVLCTAAAGVWNTAQGASRSDQLTRTTYCDFGDNKGQYAVHGVNDLLLHLRETQGISLTYLNENIDTYMWPENQPLINYDSRVDSGTAAGIGYNFIATVQHNGVIDPTFTASTLGDSNAIHYAGIEYRSSTNNTFLLVPGIDYKVTRLSKIITDVTGSSVYTGDYPSLKDQTWYRSGSGTMYVVNPDNQRQRESGAYSYCIGGIMDITSASRNAKDGQVDVRGVVDDSGSIVINKWGWWQVDQINRDGNNPLPFVIQAGDSGSPTWIYDEATQSYLYAGAMQSGEGEYFSQARYAGQWTEAVMKYFNRNVEMPGAGTIHIGVADVQDPGHYDATNNVQSHPYQGKVTTEDGVELQTYLGLKKGNHTWKDLNDVQNNDNWYAYGNQYLNTGAGLTYADLFETQDLVFKGDGGKTYNIEMDGDVDLGLGYMRFTNEDRAAGQAAYNLSNKDGVNARLDTAGFIVDAGVDVYLNLNGTSGHAREWRKIGDGNLHITGNGDNSDILLNLGGSGTTYLEREGGYAAYNVLANNGTTVVISDIGQIKRDFTFGYGGALLDMNGQDMTWNNDDTPDKAGFTIHALTDEAVMTNAAAGSVSRVTWTQGGEQEYLGSFVDTAEGGVLQFAYNGGEGSRLVLHSIYTNLHNGGDTDKSGIIVESGTLALQGTNTLHAPGSLGANFSNARYFSGDDWHYADSKTDVTVEGGTFELGHHARLTGTVTVQDGGTFLMREGVTHRHEYVEGGYELMDTNEIAGYFGLKGNVHLNEGGTMLVKFNDNADSALVYNGRIDGTGHLMVDSGIIGGLVVLSGDNTGHTGAKELQRGGMLVTDLKALGNVAQESGKWHLTDSGYLVLDTPFDTLSHGEVLQYVRADSDGILALTQDTTEAFDLSKHRQLIIGANQGEVVQYGSKDKALAAQQGEDGKMYWRFGGGGGELVVNFQLNDQGDQPTNLVLGADYAKGVVYLTNKNDFSGTISFKGGVTLRYDSDDALGSASFSINYTNRVMVPGGLDKVETDSAGALLVDQIVDKDLNLTNHTGLAIGSQGNVSYQGDITVAQDAEYHFGGATGTLSVEKGLRAFGRNNLDVDGQTFSGGEILLKSEAAITGDVTVRGRNQSKATQVLPETGDIVLGLGADNAIAQAQSVKLFEGGFIDLHGTEQTVKDLNIDSGGGVIDTSDSRDSKLRVSMTQNLTWSGSMDAGVVYVGTAVEGQAYTLTLSGSSSYDELQIEKGTKVVLGADNALSAFGTTYVQSGATLDANKKNTWGNVSVSGTLNANEAGFSGGVTLDGGTLYLKQGSLSADSTLISHGGRVLGKNAQINGAATFISKTTTHFSLEDRQAIGDNDYARIAGTVDIEKEAYLVLDHGGLIPDMDMLSWKYSISSADFNVPETWVDEEGVEHKEEKGTLLINAMSLYLDGVNQNFGGTVQATGDHKVILYGEKGTKAFDRFLNAGETQLYSRFGNHANWLLHRLDGTGTVTADTNAWVKIDGEGDFNGTFTKDTGTLELAHTGALAQAQLNLKNGAILAVSAETAKVKSLGGSGTLLSGAAGDSESTRNTTLEITTGGTTYSGSVAGDEQQGLSLRMNGSGTQTFSGADVKLQDIDVQSGTLAFTNEIAPVVYGDISIAQGATLNYAGKTLSLGVGQTLRIVDGTGETPAAFSGNLDFAGGRMLFDSSILSDSVAALDFGGTAGFQGETSSLVVNFSNDKVLDSGRYMLSTGNWDAVDGKVSSNSLVYHTAAFTATEEGLFVDIGERTDIQIWLGTSTKNNWTSQDFGSEDNRLQAESTAIFNDDAENSNVSITESAQVKEMVFDNKENAYRLVAGAGTIVQADSLRQLGTGSTELLMGNFQIGEAAVEAGSLSLGKGSRVGNISVAEDATLVLKDGEAATGKVSGKGSVLVNWGAGKTGQLDADVANLSVESGTVEAAHTLADTVAVKDGGQYHATTGTHSSAILLEGADEPSDTAALQLSGGVEVDGRVTVAANAAVGVDSEAAGTISGNVEVAAGITLTKTGAGTLSLGADNSATFAGGLVIADGTVKAGNNHALGSTAEAGRIVVAKGGTLDVNGVEGAVDAYAIIMDGGTLANTGAVVGTGKRQLVTSMVLTADSTVCAESGHEYALIANGYAPTSINLQGHTLNKTGNGTYSLTRTTVTGGEGGTLKVSEGTLNFLTNGGAGSLRADLEMAGGTVSGTLNPGQDISIRTTGQSNITAAIVTGGNGITFTGEANLNASGVISGEGAVTKDGTGDITLGAANTFTGGTNINAGTVVAGNNKALGSGAVSVGAEGTLKLASNLTLSGGMDNSGTIDMGTNKTLTLNGQEGGTTYAVGKLVNADSATLSVGNNATAVFDSATSINRVQGQAGSTVEVAKGTTLALQSANRQAFTTFYGVDNEGTISLKGSNGDIRLSGSADDQVFNLGHLAVDGESGTTYVLTSGAVNYTTDINMKSLSGGGSGHTLQVTSCYNGDGEGKVVDLVLGEEQDETVLYTGKIQYGIGTSSAKNGSGLNVVLKDENVASCAVLEGIFSGTATQSATITVDTARAKVKGLTGSGNASRSMEVSGTQHSENRVLELVGDETYTYGGKLGANLDVVHSGSGTQNITGGADDFSGSVAVDSGVLNMFNIAKLVVNDVSIGPQATLGVYNSSAATADIAHEGTLTIRDAQTLTAEGPRSALNANLVMETGSILDVHGTEGTGMTLRGALTLNKGMNLSQADLAAIMGLADEDTYNLFNGVDSLTLSVTPYDKITPELRIDAAEWFHGIDPHRIYMVYDGENVGVYCMYAVPEPATGTLSLLALAALAARRRRK